MSTLLNAYYKHMHGLTGLSVCMCLCLCVNCDGCILVSLLIV